MTGSDFLGLFVAMASQTYAGLTTQRTLHQKKNTKTNKQTPINRKRGRKIQLFITLYIICLHTEVKEDMRQETGRGDRADRPASQPVCVQPDLRTPAASSRISGVQSLLSAKGSRRLFSRTHLLHAWPNKAVCDFRNVSRGS